jgi:predicted PurR-regulated permease PerM
MAFAVLLGFAPGPPVMLLRRWHFSRVPSVIVVIVLAFLIIVGIDVFVGSQPAHLAEELPGYQTNITEKIHLLRDTTTSGGIVDRTSAMPSNLEKPQEKGAGCPANESPGFSHDNPQ